MEVVQRLIRKAGFSREVAWVATADLRHSAAALCQSKRFRFPDWCDRWSIDPCKVSVPRIAEFFPFLCWFLDLSVPEVKGYQPALNYVFSLMGMDLAASTMMSWMLRSFGRSCLSLEIRPSGWNLSLVLGCLSGPPFEPLKLASDKHLTWKMSSLLSLASYKSISELHGPSCRVCHSHCWRFCLFSCFPGFVAKTRNPSVPASHFKEFLVPSLDDFISRVRDKLLLDPFIGLCKSFTRSGRYRPGFEGLFVSTCRL